MPIYVYRVDIYEPKRPFPVVRHEFRGTTKKEAFGYYQSHLAADDFLYDCVEKGEFDHRVECHAEGSWRTERTENGCR